jgi:hypothetical protein
MRLSPVPAWVTVFHHGVLVQEHVRLAGENLLHRQAEVQALRHGADQAAGARRSVAADQLPQHLCWIEQETGNRPRL